MITLYRITNYPRHTFIEYQGDEKDKKALESLGFVSYPSKQGYDANFFFKISKDQDHEDSLSRLKGYFASNFGSGTK